MAERGGGTSLYIERYGGASLLLGVFAVYVITLAPGVTFWDSGELILGALGLGIPHPPGAPGYCIAGKAVSFIPVGSGAFRMNVMSAGCGALSAYLVYRLAASLSGGTDAGRALGLLGGAAFAFTAPGWTVSVVSEVYALSCVLMLLVALSLSFHARGGGTRALYMAAFMLGLSLATHQSGVFVLPAFLLYLILGAGIREKPGRLPAALAFLVLGLSVALYLPVRAAAGPALNIGDPDSVYRIGWVLRFGENLGTLGRLVRNSPLILEKLGVLNVAAAGAVFAVLAYVYRRRPVMLFMLTGAALLLGGIAVLTSGAAGLKKWGQTDKFYVLGLSLALPFAAASAARLLEPLSSRPARSAFSSGTALAAAALSVWLVSSGFAARNHTLDRYAYTFAKDTLNSVWDDGVLVGWGDNGTFPVWYVQEWEHYRDDTLFLHNELLTYAWYMEETKSLLRDRYGVEYDPPAPLTDLKRNVHALNRALAPGTRLYLDFSAVYQLGMEWDRFHPQGMAYLFKDYRPIDQSYIWDKIYMPRLVESGADRAFATEGVLDIYGYQCYLWGMDACMRMRASTAERAFAEAEILAPGKYTAECGPDGRVKNTGSSFGGR